MKIVIVEDEHLIAEELSSILLEIDPQIEVQKSISSVEEGLVYFQSNPLPELFFSDIQLGDGLSFELYRKIRNTKPIIFCTAFDQYALEAFKTNGIDYILKPFDKEEISKTLNKYRNLKGDSSENSANIENLFETLLDRTRHKGNILVYKGESIIPVPKENIAVISKDQYGTFIYTFKGEKFFLDQSLDIIHQKMGDEYFRVNRQTILCRSVIKKAARFHPRRLVVHLNIDFSNKIFVSKERTTLFLDWLSR